MVGLEDHVSCVAQAWSPDIGPKPAPDKLDMKGKEIFFKLGSSAVCEPLVKVTLHLALKELCVPLSEGEHNSFSCNFYPFVLQPGLHVCGSV